MVLVQFLLLGSCDSFVLFSMPRREFLIFFVWNFQTVITWNPCFRKVFHFLCLFLMMEPWICCGMWYNCHCQLPCHGQLRLKKVEHVKTWLLNFSLAKFQQFRSDFFFSKFCWVEFLLVTSSIFICCIKGPCFSRSCLVWARNVFFFSSEIFKLLTR